MVQLIEIIIYTCLFCSVYYIVSKIKRRTIFTKFLKRRYIKMFRANIIVLVLSVLVDFGFSASASLKNTKFSSFKDMLNWLSGSIGLAGALLMISIIPIALFMLKN